MKTLCLLAATVLTGCTGLFFYPYPKFVRTPKDIGLAYEPVRIDGEGEPTLVGWYLPATSTLKGTVLFLHGNAENISTHIGQVYWLPRAGYQVFLYDYPGYGESGGVATVDSVHAGAARMVRDVMKDSRAEGLPLYLFGQSLGASVALYTAAQEEFHSTFAAVVADSPFSSYRAITRDKLSMLWLTYPFQWPLSFLVSDAYSVDRVIEQIKAPILLLHGEEDLIVPSQHTHRLCEQLRDGCIRWEVTKAGHGQVLFQNDVRERLLGFLEVVSGIR